MHVEIWGHSWAKVILFSVDLIRVADIKIGSHFKDKDMAHRRCVLFTLIVACDVVHIL